MSRATPERLAAAHALLQFLHRPGRLDRWIAEQSEGLSSDQRRRARALLYAALRNDALIELHLRPFLPQPLSTQRPAPRAALILGATELMFMDGVPDRAAVDQAVELCRALGGARQGGFVNAVLRRLSRGESVPTLPDRAQDPLGWACVACSHPAWLVQEMARRVGADEVAAWCAANQEEPDTVLTVPDDHARGSLQAELGATPGLLSPWALRLPRGAGRIEELPGFAEGAFWVQDEAAQLAARLLGAQPGERVLDACAAPGGKALTLAAAVGPAGTVVATDKDRSRLRGVDQAATRVGAPQIVTGQRDWIGTPFGALDTDAPFDRVLVDAPCSGLGVLRRHPDIRAARRAEDLPRYGLRQGQLLAGVAGAVRPGGVLVYAVCTFSHVETDEVVRAALDGPLASFSVVPPTELLPETPAYLVSGDALRTLPHRDASDGFYAVAFRRRS